MLDQRSIPAVAKTAIHRSSRPYAEGAVTAKPLAVIGASGGRYGGVWAHDETRKSFGRAGARVVDAISLSIPISSLGRQGRTGEYRGGGRTRRGAEEAGRRSGLSKYADELPGLHLSVGFGILLARTPR